MTPAGHRVRAGQWIVVFGTAVEVLGVAESTAFPGAALQLLLRTRTGQTTTMPVPVDFEPVTIPVGQMAHTGPGPAPRRVGRAG